MDISIAPAPYDSGHTPSLCHASLHQAPLLLPACTPRRHPNHHVIITGKQGCMQLVLKFFRALTFRPPAPCLALAHAYTL
eukprot:191277-Chlamydomonas_euryale.AAC.4